MGAQIPSSRLKSIPKVHSQVLASPPTDRESTVRKAHYLHTHMAQLEMLRHTMPNADYRWGTIR